MYLCYFLYECIVHFRAVCNFKRHPSFDTLKVIQISCSCCLSRVLLQSCSGFCSTFMKFAIIHFSSWTKIQNIFDNLSSQFLYRCSVHLYLCECIFLLSQTCVDLLIWSFIILSKLVHPLTLLKNVSLSDCVLRSSPFLHHRPVLDFH